MSNYLVHYGTPRHSGRYPYGSGDRPYQDIEGTPAYTKKMERADKKFVKKYDKKIRRAAEKAVNPAMKEYDRQLRRTYQTRTSRGKVARNYATAYSKILADLMNTAIGDIQAPSGRVIKFVAKRGEIGVLTALADPSYDMKQLKNGVYTSGKVAYRKEEVSKMSID